MDLVVGAIANYTNYDYIKHWVNSLEMSGYKGHKMLICSNIPQEINDILAEKNVITVNLNSDGKFILVERFYYYWDIINQIHNSSPLRYVIATDVSDVIFQRNPIEFLEKNLTQNILSASESIKYKDESWGRNNLTQSFGDAVYNFAKDSVVNNAGVMAGEASHMIDLFLNIYLTCGGAPKLVEGGGGPDQAAYNVLLNTTTYKNNTNFVTSEDGWAAQLGTTGPQVKDRFGPYLVEESPILVNDTICTSQGEPFYIVHQYNRVPEWHMILKGKYA
jgi:hypothetical protein